MQLVDDHSVAYLIGLNYEFAFYSQRRIAVIGSPRPDWPDYLLVDAQFYPNWRADRLSNFDVALESGPANLDGSGALILLRRQSSAQPPKPATRDKESANLPLGERKFSVNLPAVHRRVWLFLVTRCAG